MTRMWAVMSGSRKMPFVTLRPHWLLNNEIVWTWNHQGCLSVNFPPYSNNYEHKLIHFCPFCVLVSSFEFIVTKLVQLPQQFGKFGEVKSETVWCPMSQSSLSRTVCSVQCTQSSVLSSVFLSSLITTASSLSPMYSVQRVWSHVLSTVFSEKFVLSSVFSPICSLDCAQNSVITPVQCA